MNPTYANPGSVLLTFQFFKILFSHRELMTFHICLRAAHCVCVKDF